MGGAAGFEGGAAAASLGTVGPGFLVGARFFFGAGSAASKGHAADAADFTAD